MRPAVRNLVIWFCLPFKKVILVLGKNIFSQTLLTPVFWPGTMIMYTWETTVEIVMFLWCFLTIIKYLFLSGTWCPFAKQNTRIYNYSNWLQLKVSIIPHFGQYKLPHILSFYVYVIKISLLVHNLKYFDTLGAFGKSSDLVHTIQMYLF